MGGEVEMLRERISFLEEENDNLMIEKEIALTKMEQAAEHGLLLLQQKSQLQRDLNEANELNQKATLENKELITELERKKNELEDALEAAHDRRRNLLLDSVNKEERLLQGNMMLEEEVLVTKKRAEDELLNAKQLSHNAKQEVERLTQVNQLLQADVDRLENRLAPLVGELREQREREKRLMSDFNELEEENCSLQRSLAHLKQQQLAVDSLQHESARLEEENAFWKQKADEEEHIKKVLERQLDECLESLEREREEKMSLRRELGELHDREHLPRTPTRSAIDATMIPAPDSPASDASTEAKNLRDRLRNQERVEVEKESLLRELEKTPEMEMMRARAQGEVERFKRDNSRLSARIAQLEQEQHEIRKEAATKEHLEARIEELSKEANKGATKNDKFESESTKAREMLTALSEEIAAMYHLTCLSRGIVPERIILRRTVSHCLKETEDNQVTLVKPEETTSPIEDSKNQSESPKDDDQSKAGIIPAGDQDQVAASLAKTSEKNKLEISKLKPNIAETSVVALVQTLNEQIKLLNNVVETKPLPVEKITIQENGVGKKPEGVQEMLEVQSYGEDTDAERNAEIIGLKALISSKNERIATLRTVLKANKHTAESALGSLKKKYDEEKKLVQETMARLRSELRTLKEDAAVFSSLRAVFAARCDEYVLQLDELQRQLQAAEDEKKTLNRLLRMAIEQKLALTQRLEDAEFEIESLRNNSRFSESSKTKSRNHSSRSLRN